MLYDPAHTCSGRAGGALKLNRVFRLRPLRPRRRARPRGALATPVRGGRRAARRPAFRAPYLPAAYPGCVSYRWLGAYDIEIERYTAGRCTAAGGVAGRGGWPDRARERRRAPSHEHDRHATRETRPRGPRGPVVFRPASGRPSERSIGERARVGPRVGTVRASPPAARAFSGIFVPGHVTPRTAKAERAIADRPRFVIITISVPYTSTRYRPYSDRTTLLMVPGPAELRAEAALKAAARRRNRRPKATSCTSRRRWAEEAREARAAQSEP